MRWFPAIVLAAAATAVVADDNAGQIKSMSGNVQVERDGKRLPAALGALVRQGDTIVTGADGTVGITFSDNTLLSAGPDSVLAIDRYRFEPVTHAGNFDASLKRGTLAVVSGKMVKQSPDAMRVRTPASIMGVRGTEFIVRVPASD